MRRKEIYTVDFSLLEKKLPSVPRGTKLSIQNFIRSVFQWNEKINLTGAKTPEEYCLHHVLDSYWALRAFSPQEGSFLDVGSGSGLPGIIWALFRPRWKLFLIEANQKKASFLLRALSILEISNAQVINERVENLNEPWLRIFKEEPPYCVSRGTASPGELFKLISRLKFPWKSWIAFSTPSSQQEFLTLQGKFAMRVRSLSYERDLEEEAKKSGLLTEIIPKTE